MTVPKGDPKPVDAGLVIGHLERIVTGLVHDLAVCRAHIDALTSENDELARQIRVQDATS